MFYAVTFFLFLTIIGFLAGLYLLKSDDLVVQLPKGRIRGHTLKSGNGNEFYAFQQIPYAAPPVGNNRFKLPQEPKLWQDILDTTKNTVICYQASSKHSDLSLSEDCLYLNVYTPLKPNTRKSLLPVLVFIHGGGYIAQSGAYQYYGPKFLMDYDIIVVTLNYRLGPFGFLTTEDEVIPANLGLKDQQFALEWVQNNIELFNGDPTLVTIAGQSTGSQSVGLHILGSWSNETKKTFRAAIMQSGSPLAGYNYQASQYAFELGRALNGTFISNSSLDLLEILMNASTDEIFSANVTAVWRPTIEKSGDFSYPYLKSFQEGNFKRVPLLIGFTSEEDIIVGSYTNAEELAAPYDKNPDLLLNPQMVLANRSLVAQSVKELYVDSTFVNDIGAYIQWRSDYGITTHALKQAQLESNFTNVYFYQFAYKGYLGQYMYLPKVPGTESVSHTEDLYYIWQYGTNNSDLSIYPEKDQLISKRMLAMFTNFVKYMNPTPMQDHLLQNIIWDPIDPYQPETLEYMNINDSLEIHFKLRRYQALKKIFDEYLIPPYIVY